MKNIFQGFYQPTQPEFKELWEKATFVLDTNVILNLYRYPAEAREELIKVMDSLKDRLWIPYYVALEYQKNRLQTISDQKKTITEVISCLKSNHKDIKTKFDNFQLKKRHSSINPEDILESLDKVFNEQIKKIQELDENQLGPTDEDKVRLRIDEILKDNIGKSPEDQKKLDDIYIKAEKRFNSKIPPGYKDRKKGSEKDPECFLYNDLIYNRKYGDYLVWVELLEHAKNNSLEYIIFITDDEKEDWWLYINSFGEKKIGPRPELVKEIVSFSKVKSFYMYNSEQFLKYAKENLPVQISDESIKQVKEIISKPVYLQSKSSQNSKNSIILNWLTEKYSIQEIERFGGINQFLVTTVNHKKLIFKLKYITPDVDIYDEIGKLIRIKRNTVRRRKHIESIYIFTLNQTDINYDILVTQFYNPTPPEYLKIIIGKIINSKELNKSIFTEMLTLH